MIEESIHNQRPTPTEDTDPPPVSILLSRRTWQGWKSRGRERGFGFSANREQPPGRDGDRQPEAFGPCRSRHAGILPLPPAALDPFESLLDPGSQPVPTSLGGLGGTSVKINQGWSCPASPHPNKVQCKHGSWGG